MNKKVLSLSIITVLIATVLLASIVLARPWRPALLPNAKFGCATCHIDPNGGGPRNLFGQDWERIAIPAGDKYTPELAAKDSDGDGFTNQQEFDAGTRPGDPNSFPIVTFTITSTADPNGSILPSGSVTVNSGANRTFIITPNVDFHILDVKVDGVSVGAVSSYTFLSVKANHTINATFEQNVHQTFTIASIAGANGIISPSGSVTVDSGASQSFTIISSTGYHIANVLIDGASVGTVSTYTFNNVTADHTISTTFEIDKFTITASAIANGTISPSGNVTVNYGSTQTFIITPSQNFRVANVDVDGVSVGAITSYTFNNVTANHDITASFVKQTFIINATTGSNGQITPTGNVPVDSGSFQRFTITPDPGFGVADVTVDGTSVGKVTEYTFNNVTSEHTINAVFEKETFTIEASAGLNGSITPSGVITVDSGTSQTFTIFADANYLVTDVLVDGASVGTLSSYTFNNVLANHTITASFERGKLNITATIGTNGTIIPSGVVVVDAGTDKTFSINPDIGFHIQDVLVDGTSVGAVPQYIFSKVVDNHSISALFTKNIYTITASASANGKITPSGKVDVIHGSDQSFIITPDADFHVLDVKVDNVSVGAISSYDFTNITDDHTLSVTFEQNIHPTNKIISTSEENGSISPSGSVTVDSGTSQKFTINPAVGYHVADVLVDGKSVGAVNEYIFDKVDSDHTISTTFAINIYVIKSNVGVHGKITPSGDVNVNHGTDQAFSILPDEGFSVQDVIVDGKSVGPVTSYTFTNVTSDHTIDAAFIVTPVNVPDISVSPIDGNFADVKISNSSEPLFFSITNKGTADLNVLDVVLSDTVNYTLDMTSATDACGGTKSKIVIGEKCGFAVVFKPTSLGAKLATLKIVSDDPDTPNLDIKLTGNGTGIKGDVNDDSQIRSNDAILALRIAAELAEPNAYQKWSADMNDDGNIRANDAILILRKAAGLGSPERNLLARSIQHITITLDEAYGLKGETITIPLRLDNKDALSGGDICITFDSKVLRVIDVSTYNDILMVSNKTEAGTVRISFATLSKFESETIANIKFEVISDNVSPLNFKAVELYGTDSLPIISKAINKKFTSWMVKPSKTALLQNFPNPFNPETWIPYQLKEDANVFVRVYNIKGELVRELNLGYKTSGIYMAQNRSAYWDGKNELGESVASGLYFYTIQAGEFTATKKMIVKK